MDRLEKQGSEVLKTKKVVRLEFTSDESVDGIAFKIFSVSVSSFIDKFYGSDHLYYLESQKSHGSFYNSAKGTEILLGILRVIREEFESGFFYFNLKGLISGEIFSDYLEMAEHLLDEGYKDAADVIISSSLESHLRQLCSTNSISLGSDSGKGRKSAQKLNEDLYKDEIYSKTDLKQVEYLLDIRNSAAHGDYDNYDNERVSQMLLGVTSFISNHPIK